MNFSALTAGQRLTVLLELMGGPRYAAEMRKASVATTGLGAATRRTGYEMTVASRRTFIMNQAMYTLRRYSFFATTALIGASAAVVKLGYSYLSAMQAARVALSPVIKDTSTLNGYLNQLFQISKYSPFVITDLAVAFRQLFAGLNPVGIGGQQIINLMAALTDFMSATGKTGPGQIQRVAIALQHMAYAGRVTGYAANQLARLGIPVAPILKSFGVTDVRNLSKQNISADAFIKAIIGYSNTAQFKNAARRQALRTLPGLFQVARDTISQISGTLINKAYGGPGSGLQGLMTRLFAPGGSFDKISTQRTGKGVLFELNRQITGNTGLARGLIMLLNLTKNLGLVFARILVPAFVIALHSLIVFAPAIWAINRLLGFMVKHAKLVKWIFAILATEFVITHSAMIGVAIGARLISISTFGLLPHLKTMIKYIRMLRTLELVGGIARLKDWAFATEQAGTKGARFGQRVYKNTGLMAGFTRQTIRAIGWLKKFRVAMIEAGLIGAAGAGLATGGVGAIAFAYSKTITTPAPVKIGRTSVGTDVVVSQGRRYVQTPGGRLTRLPPNAQMANDGGQVIHTHVHLNGKEIANAVDKVKQDRRARK